MCGRACHVHHSHGHYAVDDDDDDVCVCVCVLSQALRTALELGHSNKLLSILSTVLEEATCVNARQQQQQQPQAQAHDDDDDDDVRLSMSLDQHVTELLMMMPMPMKDDHDDHDDANDDEQRQHHRDANADADAAALNEDAVEKLLSYLVDWNANARHCYVSQALLSSLLRVMGVQRLCSVKGWRRAVDALLAFTDRHFQRIDRLAQASFVLEYMASQMSLIATTTTMTVTMSSTLSGADVNDVMMKQHQQQQQQQQREDDDNDNDNDSQPLVIFAPVNSDFAHQHPQKKKTKKSAI